MISFKVNDVYMEAEVESYIPAEKETRDGPGVEAELVLSSLLVYRSDKQSFVDILPIWDELPAIWSMAIEMAALNVLEHPEYDG